MLESVLKLLKRFCSVSSTFFCFSSPLLHLSGGCGDGDEWGTTDKKFSSFVRQLNFYGFRKVKSSVAGEGVDSKWWEFKVRQKGDMHGESTGINLRCSF